jgi:hypothetical protein
MDAQKVDSTGRRNTTEEGCCDGGETALGLSFEG